MKYIILILLLCTTSQSFAAKKTKVVKYIESIAQPTVTIITGHVYERGSDFKTAMFNYERRVWQEGEYTKGQSSYFDLGGKLLQREEYTFKDNKVISHEYHQHQVNEYGTAKINGKKISVSFSEDGKTQSKEIEDDGVLILPMSIAQMLSDNWEKIMNGATVETRFISVERLDTIGFSFKKKADLTYEGKEAVQIQMKPTSFIIASIVDPILMTLEKGGEHRLLESNGRLPVRVSKYGDSKKRSDWKALDAVLKIDYK
jgi:hypothetical protein